MERASDPAAEPSIRIEEAQPAAPPPPADDDLIARVVESMSDAFVALDREWRVTHLNRRAARLFGRADAAALLGRRIWDEIPAAVGQPFHRTCELALGGRHVLHVVDRHPSARPGRWLESHVIPGRDGLAILLHDVTEMHDARTRLRESRSRFRAMVEHLSDAITIVDATGQILYASPSSRRVLGHDPTARVGRSGLENVHPDDVERVGAALRELAASRGQTTSARFRIMHADGTERHVVSIAQNLLDDPAVRGIVVNTRDVSPQVEAEAALRSSEARYRAVFESAGVGVARVSPEGLWLEVNPRLEEISGWPAAALEGRRWTELLHPDDREREEERPRPPHLDDDEPFSAEMRLVRPDGEIVWVRTTMAEAHDAGGEPETIVVVEDVTERRDLEARLRELAFHDALTGLANRALFTDRVSHAFDRAARQGLAAAVLFIDLDGFKTVNDSLGHAAGDKLLLAAAARLRQTVRHSDTAARLGGDEFAVLVEDAHSSQDAVELAERVAAAFLLPFDVGGRSIVTPASIGVAVAERGETPEEVLRNADVAMYVAERSGRGSFEVFAPGMHAAVVARLEMEEALRHALGGPRGEGVGFRLVFQPIVELASGRVVGAETLLRWSEPDRGEVAPATFIPVAEDTGLIVPLGRWVLREACRTAARWDRSRAGRAPLQTGTLPRISVNVSGRQLADPGFVDDVRLALEETGLAPERLLLELTESVLIHHAPEIAERLQALRALGTRLAVDDFGTGYSSLGYLLHFPLDVIKVDRSFVRALGSQGPDAAIARAVVALGNALELETIAEGVESARQAELLVSMGCRSAQGFHFGRPMPAGGLEQLA